ncbi:unnamed protein product [Angiostrongylus costaricensis]|uniref:Uncharacterized protein n=1 Tax=Angiostrongylus costaricensis TaxID=334426 RepID=A0A0R3PGC0_ANGCS|nr:unnamed protein product [Angiostrongylus costaricensis]
MRMNDTDGQEPLVIGFLGMSNVLEKDDRPDGQSSSQRALKKDVMLDEFLERAEPTGLLLHATKKMEDLLAPARVTRCSAVLQVIYSSRRQSPSFTPQKMPFIERQHGQSLLTMFNVLFSAFYNFHGRLLSEIQPQRC